MRNLESLAELKKQGKMRIEERRDNFVRQSLLSDEFLDLIQRNKKPFDLLMCYYECAIMEVETKFKVLNQEHSLEYDRNPIESIKTRVKSYESILKKIRKKDIPITMEAIEEKLTAMSYTSFPILWFFLIHRIHTSICTFFSNIPFTFSTSLQTTRYCFPSDELIYN